jgi:hypothetical protein
MKDENEIRVGDRVRDGCNEPGTVIGLHAGRSDRWAWVEYDEGNRCYGIRVGLLTRIEPAVPEALFRVGQRVRLKNDALDFPGEMGQVIHLGYYVSRSGHWGTWVVERKLEAVPEVCPTCGGKVADG